MPPRNQRSLGGGSSYAWNSAASRYVRRSTGQFVARATVRNALNRALTRAKGEMRSLSEQLARGDITLVGWQLGMADGLRATHLYAAAIARGGFAQLDAADYGRIGLLLRSRYGFLNRFAAEIEAGLVRDGRFLQRAGMYINASRTAFQHADRAEMEDNQGMTEERNVLAEAENCAGCLDATDEGWVPIGELPDIGARDCLTNCQCEIEYR
jgi:hypothetical protein